MIYILEDDASIRKLVVYTLNSQGMEAEGFERPSQFWSALEEKKPDLVLLDIMLPEEDGLQVLKRLRADPNTRKLPVLMLTAKSTEYDKVLGLDQGADDYITKPFGMMELMARIRTALRHAGSSGEEDGATYQVGELYVDPGRHIVRDGDRAVYDIEFYSAEKEYDYEIDALTGEILKREQEPRQTSGASGQSLIGVEKVKKLAAEHAGLTVSQVKFTECELDRDDGRVVYELEFRCGGEEYEYTVDACSGAILEAERD